jgi:glycosyltransferase involved in cell wall biosynthesis
MENRTTQLRSVFDSTWVKPPLVSVIVTSFNYAPYIEACLSSIARQSYRHFVCVVVDDVSSDGSVEVIDRFIHSDLAAGKFRLQRHSENEGQMAAFQTGLQYTDGPFVVFVDADDLLFPEFLETHLKAHLNSARLAAFTNSELLQISADGQVLSGIQGISGTPSLRSSRAPDGHKWSLSTASEFALEQPLLPVTYLGTWDICSTDWIWSTTSATMFRRAVLDVIMSPESRCLRISADRYIFNFSHGIGGSLLIPSVHGCYRRHGINGFGANPVLGGDTFLGDNRKDPIRLVNVLIFEDILRKFELFCSLFGRSHTIRLLIYFRPRGLRDKLKLALTTSSQLTRAGQFRKRTRPTQPLRQPSD